MCSLDGVDNVQERTKKLLIELFNEAQMSPEQPTPDELFDYAYTVVNSEIGVAHGLQQHRYIEQEGTHDAHYQAIIALLQQEKQGGFIQPPITAHFDFSYLDPPVSNPWYLALGKIMITFTAQILNTLAPNPSPQLALKRAVNEIPIFTFGFDTEQGVAVQIAGKVATDDAATCTVVVGVKPAARVWPGLSGIPVTLATEGSAPTIQLTDPFGRAHFHTVERSLLPDATVTIGPLAELQTDMPR